MRLYLRPVSGVGRLGMSLSPPGQNGSRARGAKCPDGILSSTEFSACPRVGLTDVPFERKFSSQWWVGNQSPLHMSYISISGGLRVKLELGAVFPHCPDDTGQFIGYGDHRLIVTASSEYLETPSPKSVGRLHLLRMPENTTGTMSEKHSNVAIAMLADATEPSDVTGGALSGGESKKASKLSRRAKPLNVSHESNQRR